MLQNRQTINKLHTAQTVLKALFIIMSPFNMSYTLLVAFASSFIGVLRVFKTIQFSKQFLQKILMNNHGQNLLYISFGMSGQVNYLYYAPIALFFLFGVAQYVNMRYPQTKYQKYVDMIRNNRAKIFQTKGVLEVIFLIYTCVTIFFDLFSKLIKIFLLAQMLIMKYKVSAQFRGSCHVVDAWILTKTSGIDILHSNYKKVSQIIYNYASKDMMR